MDELFAIWKARFEAHPSRHEGISWSRVLSKLEAHPLKVRAIEQMEQSGGEPDVIGHDPKTNEYLIVDCCAESPSGRRSLCYDRAGLESRKEHAPRDSALDVARAMGIELLTEQQYQALQSLGQLTRRPRVGWPRPSRCANLVVRFLGIADTVACSSTTTARNPITPPGGFAGYFGSDSDFRRELRGEKSWRK